MSEEFIKIISAKSKHSKTTGGSIINLIGLSAVISEWNATRIGRIKNSKDADLTMDNIQSLKKLIKGEVKKSEVKNIAVVSDQILFLFIGAIKLQIQNNSDKPWRLVNQSISNFLTPKQRPQTSFLFMMMLTIIVILGFLFSSLNLRQTQVGDQTNSLFDVATVNESGSRTVSSLVNLYEAMKTGDCQLPQAAMLQPAEREAFISFVNEGKVDINTASYLKNALHHTACLYPQKLMSQPL